MTKQVEAQAVTEGQTGLPGGRPQVMEIPTNTSVGRAIQGEERICPRCAVCYAGTLRPTRLPGQGRQGFIQRQHHLCEAACESLGHSERRPVRRRGATQAEESCVAWRQWQVWREVRPPDWMAAGRCEG